MEVIERKEGPVTILTLQARYIGAAEAGHIMDTLHELRERGEKSIVIDLGPVQTMNSSGLGALISGLNTMRLAGGEIKLTGVNEKVDKLLTITKLHSVFESFASVEEAVESFAGLA